MNAVRRALRDRGARARLAGEDGVTLAELMVAIMIFGIILMVVSTTFISLSKATSSARVIDGNVRQASNGMNELSRIIRAGTNNPIMNAAPAPAFSEATNESMTVYAFVNLTDTTQRPVMVRFSINSARSLIETTTQAVDLGSGYWGFTGTSTTRTLATAVATQSGSNPYLFTYEQSDGTVLTPSASGVLTAAQMALIGQVEVTLSIKASSTSSDNGVTLQNTVGIPNLTGTGVVS